MTVEFWTGSQATRVDASSTFMKHGEDKHFQGSFLVLVADAVGNVVVSSPRSRRRCRLQCSVCLVPICSFLLPHQKQAQANGGVDGDTNSL